MGGRNRPIMFEESGRARKRSGLSNRSTSDLYSGTPCLYHPWESKRENKRELIFRKVRQIQKTEMLIKADLWCDVYAGKCVTICH